MHTILIPVKEDIKTKIYDINKIPKKITKATSIVFYYKSSKLPDEINFKIYLDLNINNNPFNFKKEYKYKRYSYSEMWIGI